MVLLPLMLESRPPFSPVICHSLLSPPVRDINVGGISMWHRRRRASERGRQKAFIKPNLEEEEEVEFCIQIRSGCF